MRDVVVVDAVRTPIGRRNGGLAWFHSVDLLGRVQQGLLGRVAIDPSVVGQVFGGCVSQVGMQSFNVTRNAWLAAGLPSSVPATTLDTQCGSSQQAFNVAASSVASGAVDVAVACGVELMSRVPLRSSLGDGVGKSIPRSYYDHHEYTTQFQAAERIAEKWSISREEADEFALASQQRAARAWAEGRFDGQVLAVDAPEVDGGGEPTGETRRVDRDEGLRETSLEALAGLKSVIEGGIHTAGSSSQISDGASAALLMSADAAERYGVTPMARVRATAVVGVDPAMMLTGPIDATHRLLASTGMAIGDFDVIENNEAFASVVLAWLREHSADIERVNPNGGAIALGHPLGSTGVTLLTKAVHELRRTDGQAALVTMCCGGGIATGTIVERV